MLNKLIRAIRQDDYIDFLKEDILSLRGENDRLLTKLYEVLHIDRLNTISPFTPLLDASPDKIRLSPRRKFMGDLQKRSWDKATRERIEKVEEAINSSNLSSEGNLE